MTPNKIIQADAASRHGLTQALALTEIIVRYCYVVLAFWILAACSSTPGDAARRTDQPAAAADLYRKGAEQGDGSAALKLGLLLSEKNLSGYGAAGEWFVKACSLENVVGCHNTGVGYEYAEHGLPQDYAQAAHYYRIAAERGYMQSQYNLGSLYSNSHADGDIEGLTWLLVSQKSARSCSGQALCKWVLEDSPGHISRLRQRMSAEAVKTAEDQAVIWKAHR